MRHASLRVMSYNICFDKKVEGQDAWLTRKDRVADLIRFHEVDLVGLQEALINQLNDLEKQLPGYAWFGTGREGEQKGEFSAVLYRKDRFKLLEQETFWLSETPRHVGSIGWDAALPRIVTWGRFQDHVSKVSFFHFNTHFDHVGVHARKASTELFLSKVVEVAEQSPVIATGDFIFEDTQEEYQTITSALGDAYGLTVDGNYGPSATYFDAEFRVTENPGKRLDYIFIKNGVEVLRHAILSDSWGGRYPSDHLPVLAEVSFSSRTSLGVSDKVGL